MYSVVFRKRSLRLSVSTSPLDFNCPLKLIDNSGNGLGFLYLLCFLIFARSGVMLILHCPCYHRDQAEIHRRRAREQSRVSAECMQLAKRAHCMRQLSTAKKYEAEAKAAKELSQEHNKQAEELGYMASNLGKVCIHIMDFHLLHASEALDRCQKVVKNLQDFVDTVGGCLYKLKIITGRGNNSHKQTPVLRPQIMEYLQNAGYSPFLEEANQGVVCVFIEPKAGEVEPPPDAV